MYQKEKLDQQLNMAAKSFVNQEIEVIDDSGTKKVLLTKLLLWYKKDFGQNDNEVLDKLRCGSCHFDRASNNKFNVEFWMFVLIFCHRTLRSDLKEVQFTRNDFF